jgi:uncharacterized protein (TIGR02996 family)
MTDRDSFLAAIAAAPADDTPRLAFADWLEEHGDAARAGFIRDQVRLATLRPGTDEYRQLFRRTADTLRANLPAWIQDLCDAFGQPAEWKPGKTRGHGLHVLFGSSHPPFGLMTARFERGFLEQPWVNARSLGDGQSLGRLLREHPISRLSLQFSTPVSSPNWAVAELKQVQSLTLDGGLTATEAKTLFDVPNWASLRRLSFGHATWAAVPYLCTSPMVKRLHGLRLPFGDAFLSNLASFPLDDAIRDLSVYPAAHRPDRDEIALTLSKLNGVTFRPTLKRLDLTGCTMGDRGLATFARGDVWIRLRALALDRNRFGDPGWRDFVRGRRTPELRTLTAGRNFLTGDGAVRLGQSPLVETLEYLDLRGNRIDGKGAVSLARYLRDGPVKKLLLTGNPLSAKDADAVRNVLGERVVV